MRAALASDAARCHTHPLTLTLLLVCSSQDFNHFVIFDPRVSARALAGVEPTACCPCLTICSPGCGLRYLSV